LKRITRQWRIASASAMAHPLRWNIGGPIKEINKSSDHPRAAVLTQDAARREFVEQVLLRYADVTKADANEALEQATRNVAPSASLADLEQEMLVLLGFGREPGELPGGGAQVTG
jgi:hypothetical protein